MRQRGIDQNALRAAGTVFAVHRIEADFLAPARLEDRLTVNTTPADRSPARLTLLQEVARAGQVLFRARVTLVAMSTEGRPRRLPDALKHIGENP